MPLTMPEPRYFSIPSAVVGGAARRKAALNWSPCVRSFTQVPLAWTNSPAAIAAAAPTTVARSRWPRTFRSEGLDQPLGVDRADALDHARAEVLLDPLGRGRRGGPQEGGPELEPVRPVVHPGAAGVDELAGRDRGGGADHRGEVALAADLPI